MGLNALVRCNCWKEGRIAPPPVPLDLIYEDQAGYLDLRLPYDGNEETYLAFDTWKATCCEHEEMDYASVRVSNWGGYRSFQQALAKAGWEHFSTLKAELPSANGGQMPPQAAAKALEELRYFREHADLGENTFLVNRETGEVIGKHIAAYDGVFTWSGKGRVNLGVDEHGFFIIDTSVEPPREVFRSLRFEQRLLESELTESHRGGAVEYIDLDSGQRCVYRAAVAGKEIPWPDGRTTNHHGQVRHEYPHLLHVERRRVTADDFAYILEPLTEIFQASVAIGNPVIWC